MNIKEAMKSAKETGEPQQVTERLNEPSVVHVRVELGRWQETQNRLNNAEKALRNISFGILPDGTVVDVAVATFAEEELKRFRIDKTDCR